MPESGPDVIDVSGPEPIACSNMNSSKKKGFCKNEDCPSSNELLDFQHGDLSRSRASDISKHLASCEFCSAEVEFYSHYPQEEGASETGENAQIPAPLYELAEALLKNRQSDHSVLNSLLKDEKELMTETF